ncbi:MAG: hypothetical protein ACRD0B_07420 [Acidimicrobiales bacterium]
MIRAHAVDLARGYEALRAQACGGSPATPPRGLAVFLRGGVVAWMCAAVPVTRTAPLVRRSAEPTGARAELVSLLTEMVLNSEMRWAT